MCIIKLFEFHFISLFVPLCRLFKFKSLRFVHLLPSYADFLHDFLAVPVRMLLFELFSVLLTEKYISRKRFLWSLSIHFGLLVGAQFPINFWNYVKVFNFRIFLLWLIGLRIGLWHSSSVPRSHSFARSHRILL